MPNLGGPQLTSTQVLFNRIQYLVNDVSLRLNQLDIPENIRAQLPFGRFDRLSINLHDYIVYAFEWQGERERCVARVQFTETLSDLLNEAILLKVELKVTQDLKREDEEKRKKEFDNRVQARMVDLSLSK